MALFMSSLQVCLFSIFGQTLPAGTTPVSSFLGFTIEFGLLFTREFLRIKQIRYLNSFLNIVLVIVLGIILGTNVMSCYHVNIQL